MSLCRFAFSTALLLPAIPGIATAQSGPPPAAVQGGRPQMTIHMGQSPQNAAGLTADQLFATGRLPEAMAKYQAMLKADPANVSARVGIIRIYLVQQKLDEARAAMDEAMVLQSNSPLLWLTQGDVQFRLGKIPEAERSYLKAAELKPDDAAPHLGLARVYRSYSLFRHAYDETKKAHEVAPNDLAVQLVWFNSLPPRDRIAALEAYLASSAGQNPKVTRALQQYLSVTRNAAAAPAHPCKLVSNVQETDTKLHAIPRPGTQLGATGLDAKINKQAMHLALDTGASGVLLGRLAAEKAGLQRLAYQPIFGMGDSGRQGGYTAVADRIRIGDLEFQDCVVRVTDMATPVTGQDGLIGPNVFSSYLIDIDIPGERLRLSPLPKRPDEIAAPAALDTAVRDPQELETESGQTSNTAAKPGEQAGLNLPKDAYVPPEMNTWTKVYRFRDLLLVPTKVDNTGPMLFLIDTGSFSNVLSTRAAREVTQVTANPGMTVKGLSGNVSKVYRADKAALQFGRYEQQNQDIVTFDLTSMSSHTGTEISGILGFAMLRILQIKIDYRDGLVDFRYDPNHLPKQIRIGK